MKWEGRKEWGKGRRNPLCILPGTLPCEPSPTHMAPHAHPHALFLICTPQQAINESHHSHTPEYHQALYLCLPCPRPSAHLHTHNSHAAFLNHTTAPFTPYTTMQHLSGMFFPSLTTLLPPATRQQPLTCLLALELQLPAGFLTDFFSLQASHKQSKWGSHQGGRGREQSATHRETQWGSRQEIGKHYRSQLLFCPLVILFFCLGKEIHLKWPSWA